MTITLTSKRQATFPVELCRKMRLHAGDKLEVEPVSLPDGRKVWALAVAAPKAAPRQPRSKWIGYFKDRIKDIPFDPAAEKEAAARGWAEEAARAKKGSAR